jgi:two-component system, NtrC family, response regulator AtoC
MTESTAAPVKKKKSGHGDLELVIFDGDVLKRVPLPPGSEITVGRGDEASIRVSEPSVSRVHAMFRGGNPASIEDLGSSNGTRVGGVDLAASKKQPLEADTMIILGELSIVIREARGPGSPPPPSLPEGSMAAVHRLINLVAPSDLSVLVLGETGVGKEIVSRAIHEKSRRKNGPLLLLNCAALPEQTIESEVFGHEKGAFTGAVTAKPGLLESAHEGTVVLDEVGEMPVAVQAKLLRALDAGEIVRLGAVKPRPIDVRIVAATNRDLGAMVEEGTFRADLLYRLDGMTIHVPPLRDRKNEITGLAEKFVKDACEKSQRSIATIGPEAMQALRAHDWPGNVRELKKVIERALVLTGGADVIDANHIVLRSAGPAAAAATAAKHPSATTPVARESGGELLRDERERAEIEAIQDALAACNGNQTRAAAQLGISRRTLIERLDRYGMPRPRKT